MKCRHCGATLVHVFLDLGSAPPSNAYLNEEALRAPEKWYPLRVLVCDHCWLVQTEDYASAEELFLPDYAYFSSYSTSWLKHAEEYVVEMIERFGLNQQSTVVEVAANDGYLLQYVKASGIPRYGIEPTASTAAAARNKGIDIIEEFFGVSLAERLETDGRQADLTVANNVLAHVADINDFVKGFSILLTPNGVSTFEFPHLLNLVEQNQFDTIYHEHYSYLSLIAVRTIFHANGLTVFDVEELPTHGGSLRIFAQRTETGRHKVTAAVEELLEREALAGMRTLRFYEGFQAKAEKVKTDLLCFLLQAKMEGKKVAAYGAAAKGNTMLNFSGIRPDLLPYVVDLNQAKQGKYLPGSRIPIVKYEKLKQDRPDYILILPWNLAHEITEQLAYIRDWTGRFVTVVPKIMIR